MRDEIDLPEYCAGRLIYTKDSQENAMRYVVYDGNKEHRFASEQAAREWCVKESIQVDSKEILKLTTAEGQLRHLSRLVDTTAKALPTEKRIEIEAIAVQIMILSDKIAAVASCYKS